MIHSEKIKIPKDATLKEIIEFLNYFDMNAHPDSKDPDFQRWLYNHKHWIRDKDV